MNEHFWAAEKRTSIVQSDGLDIGHQEFEGQKFKGLIVWSIMSWVYSSRCRSQSRRYLKVKGIYSDYDPDWFPLPPFPPAPKKHIYSPKILAISQKMPPDTVENVNNVGQKCEITRKILRTGIPLSIWPNREFLHDSNINKPP